MQSETSSASLANHAPVASLNDPALWQKSSNATWYSLQHTPLSTLQQAQTTNQGPIAKGWLTLAIISKTDSTNTQQLIKALQDWRTTYPDHPGNALIPNNSIFDQLQSVSPPNHIALLLPLNGNLAASGHIVRNGFLSAYYDNMGQSDTKQSISFYDTNEKNDITSLYQKAKAEGADLVIGPLTKPQVEALYHLGHFDVPVLALNYTSSSFFSSLPANFYEFGLSPIEETRQMSDKARQAGLSEALVIASNNDWGHRVTDALNTYWKENGGQIKDTLYFTPQTNLTDEIAALLHINPKADRELMKEDNKKSTLSEQRRHDFNVIFIFSPPEMARQIVPLLRFYYAGNVPVYSISAIYSGRPSPIRDRDINGVTFCETPWIIQMAHSSTTNPAQYDRLYAIGRDAWLLSQSLSRMNTLPNFPIYGATGAIESNQQKIVQRLPWVTVHDGRI